MQGQSARPVKHAQRDTRDIDEKVRIAIAEAGSHGLKLFVTE